jgi:hypothetical protein
MIQSTEQPYDLPLQCPLLFFIDSDIYAKTDHIPSRMTGLIQSSLPPASRPICGVFTIFGEKHYHARA